MCMLCEIQRWSRKVANMLPWLVIPLIGLWALSQLLPPAFRFEITSPRVACVFVLLITLFWYEVLMPWLSTWRERRDFRLRKQRRVEALELHKLKKIATRKCRNCLTPYREQNPCGGKFMCLYCGHVSKRPVLDLPNRPRVGISNFGIMKGMFGCNQGWLENGHGSGSELCVGERFYCGAYLLVCKFLTLFLLSIRWLWRKLFRMSFSNGDSFLEAEGRGISARKNGDGGFESRSEKARRKAEEKRQARLEKELLEEEERKQREEVTRLVEERRRLRDEQIDAENHAKGTPSLGKDSKKEDPKRQQARRKEKDKGSNRSNCNVNELDKKVGKDTGWKSNAVKTSETDRQKFTALDSVNSHSVESGSESTGKSGDSVSRGNVGAKYFNRMSTTFSSSSRAFTGSNVFGKSTQAPARSSKEIMLDNSVDCSSVSNGRYGHLPHCIPEKTIMNGNDKCNNNLVTSDAQCKTTPKSWQHLFTRVPAASGVAPSHSSVISRPRTKSQVEVQSSQPPSSVASPHLYDNPMNLPSSFVLPSIPSRSMINSSDVQHTSEPTFPTAAQMSLDQLVEEPEHFEGSYYVPDPISLLGPVSESLDNFLLDIGSNYISDELVETCPINNVTSPIVASRPPSIESSLSRQRVLDEQQKNPNNLRNIPNDADMCCFPTADADTIGDQGTWHMWNSFPLDSDGLGLVGSSTNWTTPLEQSRLSNGVMCYSPLKPRARLFTEDGSALSGTHLHHYLQAGNAQCFSTYGSSVPSLKLQNAFATPISVGEGHLPVSPTKEAFQNRMVYGNPIRPVVNCAFRPSTANLYSNDRNQWAEQGSRDCGRNPCDLKPPIDGLYSTPYVHSLRY